MIKPFVRAAMRALCRVLFRVRIEGDLAALRRERLLLVANHESLLDGLLLALFLPVHPVFVIHSGVINNRFFRILIKQVDYLLVDPTSPMAMKTVIHLIHEGRPVVIFPEGRISDTGSMMKVYDGPAFVAVKTDATVVPVKLSGTSRTYFSRLSCVHPRQLFPKITITLLPPTSIAKPHDESSKERHHHAGDAMRHLMQDMIYTTQPINTLFDALLDAAQHFGRRHRIIEDIKQIEYNYGDLLRMTLMLGRIMTRIAKPGEHVGVLLPNLTPTLGLMIGLSAFRRIPAMLNYTAGTAGMQTAIDAVQAQTIITSRAFLEQAELTEKVEALTGVNILYLEELRSQLTAADKLWWIGFARWWPRRAADPQRDKEDAAAVLFTSGSEGKPKGVMLSHRAILSNVAQMRAAVDFSADDKFFNALPIFHAFGLTAGAMVPLLTGARLFLYPSPLHYRIIPEMSYDKNCTVMLGTSTFLANYAKYAHPYDFFRLRYVIAGAEKLTQPVRELWFEKFGIRIYEGYGATETGPVLSVNTTMAYRTGSVGQLLPGIRSKLAAVPGIERGGLLHVQGANVMSGYYHAENPGVLVPPSSEFGAGWYNTGDIVDFDADGFVHIVGRVKRFAKVAGEMISLEVVERIAAAASPEHLHASTSIPDAQRGECLILYSTDPALARDQLAQAARAGGYPEIAIPRRIVVLDEMPVLGSGKTDYVTLKTRALEACTE